MPEQRTLVVVVAANIDGGAAADSRRHGRPEKARRRMCQEGIGRLLSQVELLANTK
jgi:hypothetical protein